MASYMNHFSFLQTISLFSLFFTLTWIGSSLSPDDECSALYQFKQSIIHQDDAACTAAWFQTFHSWKPTSNASEARFNCCSWYGVQCSNDHEYGLVVGLDLSESLLCGHINSNSTLFSLVHLQSLNLAMNNFNESQIPSQIAHLKQLKSLNLSDSGFSGQVPNEISQLMHLSSLDLSQNPLKLQSLGGLKNLVHNLTGLEELDLSVVDISSPIPHFLANFTSLRSIKLRDCLLMNKFPTVVLELPQLKILDVSNNANLSGSFPEFRNSSQLEYLNLGYTGFYGIVPESISNLDRMTFLYLSESSFLGRIPGSLSNLTQLTFLSLRYNKFIGFIPSLGSVLKLNVLDLSGNKFEKGHLPNWIGKLAKLSELHVNDMSINGEIPPFLANLTKLTVVAMGRNSLIGHIPSFLFNLTQLTTLDFQNNHLQGPISSSFSNLKTLQYFRLGLNNFSGRVELDMFLGLKKLETLDLGYNMISLVATNNYTNTTLPELKYLGLSTCNLKEFPSFLRIHNKMEVLLLKGNKIDGLVPVWIWNNSKETLQVIDLSQNSITGFHQHPQILPWRRLQRFLIDGNQLRGQLPIPPTTTVIYNASHNNLTGEIPPLICEVKSLQELDLSSNNMSGTLPPCFGSLSNSLFVLNLRQNNFHGTIMNAFMHGSLLQRIDLGENKFAGQLPRSLANCTILEMLSVEDNSLQDIFPNWLGTLTKLEVLLLRSNKFYGPIEGSTTAWSQFPRLLLIDLSNNRFSGQLHQEYFQTWNVMHAVYYEGSHTPYSMRLRHNGLTVLTVIDLSCNHFQGEIPPSIQDLRSVEALNLSNNRFTGHVLPGLANLQNLKSLDLSRNKLSGEIPQELVQLNFLSIFDVSFNHLQGAIPQGQKFNTFENDSYMGNPGLCGRPLSNECGDPKAPKLPPASNTSDESLLPSDIIDWIFVFCGVGSGLFVGIVIGNIL